MKEKVKHNAFLIVVMTLIVALDQWTKLLVMHKFEVGEGIAPIPALGDFFRIIHWRNTGAAFGLFQNANTVLLVLSIIIVIAVLYNYQLVKANAWLAKVSLALILSGAIGNIIDRIKLGYVVDFLSFGRFPVFNVADSAVTVGVFLLAIQYMLEERKALKQKEEEQTEKTCKECATDKEIEEVVYKVEDTE